MRLETSSQSRTQPSGACGRAGRHPTIISQRLGHSSTAFTMDTYGNLDRGLQAPVVVKLQAWLSENAPR